ncbi:MAG TPA: diguanylate cyclase [Gemmatimonadales bacterium]|nr:diguanylate cyclase [Gemmatimonadales bacterium]
MEPFEKAFDQLRREYLAEAGSRIAELRAEVDAFRSGRPEAVASLRTRFHRLVGSGGSYGFPEISSAAREGERRVAGPVPPGPDEADGLDDLIDRIAVLYSEAEAALLAETSAAAQLRLALLLAPDAREADELREAIANAGFAVRIVDPAVTPVDVVGGERAQLVVIVAGDSRAALRSAAAWASNGQHGRAVLIVESSDPVDRLDAAAAGVDEVVPAERAVTDLTRFGQRYIRLTARRGVMIVADHDTGRGAVISEALGARHVEVRRAQSATEAFEHLQGEVPDLVIAATDLPGGGGRAMARLVRQTPRCSGVPVILLGQAEGTAALSALGEGAEDVVPEIRDARALAAALLARAERGRRVREVLRRDPLTGLLNHSALVAELEHEVARAGRLGTALSFLLVRLERFGEVNEAQGYVTGDRVLAHAASVVRGTVRASDPIGRHGGRSFGVVLRGAGRDGAARIAGKLRAALAEHPYETRDGGTVPLQVTVQFAVLGEDAATAGELQRAAERR